MRATYDLEADGFVSAVALDRLEELRIHSTDFKTTRLEVTLDRIVPAPPPEAPEAARAAATALKAQIRASVVSHAQKGFDYYLSKWEQKDALGDMRPILQACRLCDPLRIRQLQGECTVAVLSALKFLSSDDIAGLTLELPKYVNVATGFPDKLDRSAWWRQHERQLPAWFKAACVAQILQPNSASVERVFSMYDNHFGKTRESSTETLIEGALMLRFNELWCERQENDSVVILD